jgi:dipeptidyl aminopeptidase/acylaminoacyl peptidase
VRQRRADPERIAIFGASYGGYAALMGAVRRPGFYKAAVSVAGPTDLIEIMRFQKRTQRGDSTVYDFWRARIGEPGVDDAEMARASPRLRAAEITAPVLLIHGTRDEIVPPSQSRLMAAALKAAGKRCATYEIPGAGHTDWGLAAEEGVIRRVVDFLATALAPAIVA